jgi:hypothetical protein
VFTFLRLRDHGANKRTKIRAAQNGEPQDRAPKDGHARVKPSLVGRA